MRNQNPTYNPYSTRVYVYDEARLTAMTSNQLSRWSKSSLAGLLILSSLPALAALGRDAVSIENDQVQRSQLHSARDEDAQRHTGP
jgi:hypothetical protein